jgi:site-specific DNA-methyltransferase (adenine-specific)
MKKMYHQFHNGDCLEVMKEFNSSFVDITITSPPYNLGNNHHTGNKKVFCYDDNLDENIYQKQQIEVLNQIHRITKNSGSLFYNHKNRIKNGVQISPYEWILKSDWIIKQELIWFNGSQNFDKIRFYPMTERIYWLVKNPKTKLKNNINAHDVFNWNPEGTNKIHKRSFPEKLVEDILLCFEESKIVFDPYMGSGTTGKVSQKLNKKFIGIEKNKNFFELAKRRILEMRNDIIFENYNDNQLDLF